MKHSKKGVLSLLIIGSLVAPVGMVLADTTTTPNAVPAGTNNSQLNSTGNPQNGSSNGTEVAGGQTKHKHHHHKKSTTATGTTNASGATGTTTPTAQ